ncbi:MAG TPA: site-specific integrase [Streptosporangiaceae bacterium]
MKGIIKRCYCRDEAGKELGARCPDLEKRHHGTFMFSVRVDTTAKPHRLLKRAGYATQTAASDGRDHVRQLVKLAGADDAVRRRIGDLIFERSKRGGELPTVEDVRRRLGVGADLDAPSATVAEWLESWLAGKRRLKDSTRRAYRQHLDNFLMPLLGQIPRDRLTPEHIGSVFDTIEEWNAEIRAAHSENRAPHLPDDRRKRKKITGVATQHRILATLRNAYNAAVKRPGMIDWNPCLAVELPPETRDPARVWSPDQVVAFFDAATSERLAVAYRLVLLRGLRRGEVCGLRWTDVDLDGEHPTATIAQTLLEYGGHIHLDTPKTRAGERVVSLDKGTAAALRAHRTAQRREQLAAGPAWTDYDLVFCCEDGRPLSPETVTDTFRRIARGAGLPVIRLHEGRHTAASLGLEAGLDIKIVSDQLGHSTTRITSDLYTHVRRAVASDAAEKIVALLPEGAAKTQDTGS